MITKERLEELIRIVNSQCRERKFTPVRKWAILASFIIFTLIFGILMWQNFSVAVVILSYVSTLPTEEAAKFLAGQAASYVALTVGVVGIIIAYPLKVIPSSVEDLTNWYFKKLSKEHEIKYFEKPYFKALIKMQCSNFDILICLIYEESKNTNSTLFDEDSLLKSLC